jgi:D-alanyl-lipoteichoic acid acyltransferase DltB (MBOAT superfamily)
VGMPCDVDALLDIMRVAGGPRPRGQPAHALQLVHLSFRLPADRLAGLTGRPNGFRRVALTVGVAGNLGLLGYFKYANFLVDSLGAAFDAAWQLAPIALPLAISFFTFQQIAYLVGTFRRETEAHDFLDYVLFVTFFPQLIAGPIVNHGEMLPGSGRSE